MAFNEYTKRLSKNVLIDVILAKNSDELQKMIERQKRVIGLDETGILMTSVEWSRFLYTEWEKGGTHICFAIGGPKGLPQPLKKHMPLISLSPMTFPHQIARLIFFEQVYRAVQIFLEKKYH